MPELSLLQGLKGEKVRTIRKGNALMLVLYIKIKKSMHVGIKTCKIEIHISYK